MMAMLLSEVYVNCVAPRSVKLPLCKWVETSCSVMRFVCFWHEIFYS